MMLLTVNSGSSSVRLGLFAPEGKELTQVAAQHYQADDHEPAELLRAFLLDHKIARVSAVAHRVVHGGTRFKAPCLLDAEAESEIGRLAQLAPLHNPRALRWIYGCRAVLGTELPQVAVFDTAFYANLPKVAATYALPREVCERYSIRRFGFHGLAHQAMWQRWRQLRPEVENGGRVISLQLGSGCSITAIERGQPKDTSMGFSPLEGLVMATRSGDVDAGALTYLQQAAGLTVEELENLLNKSSGLLGVSGSSGDMRDLLAADTAAARLAVELYCYRARKYIGAYLAVLGGAEAVLFGGGVGENAALVRERILTGMEWCGIALDRELNDAAIGREACISTPQSKIAVWVVPVDEAAGLARAAQALLE